MRKIFTLIIIAALFAEASAQTKKQFSSVKKRTKTVQIVSAGGSVPDSINKQIKAASKKIIKDLDAKMKNSKDTSVKIEAWATYTSTVLSNNVQVNMDITGHRTKVKNKLVTTAYIIHMQAEHDLFEIHFDKNLRNPSIRYNESYWPGFMYNDKNSTPKKKDLNCDISILMKSILKNGVKWK